MPPPRNVPTTSPDANSRHMTKTTFRLQFWHARDGSNSQMMEQTPHHSTLLVHLYPPPLSKFSKASTISSSAPHFRHKLTLHHHPALLQTPSHLPAHPGPSPSAQIHELRWLPRKYYRLLRNMKPHLLPATHKRGPLSSPSIYAPTYG